MNDYSPETYQFPCSSDQLSSFSDLMLMTGDYYSPTYLPAVSAVSAAHPVPGLQQKMDMGCLTNIRDHKILGKRKNTFSTDGDDDCGDDKSVRSSGDKKQNHSEIEKRRRDKMNTYITELATMIPMCHANPRKLDKLTVLRMAVQHLRSVRGAVHSYTEGQYKARFLSDEELKHLILQAAEGFLFVVGCDQGRILFVSESVYDVLHYSQGDLVGQSVFDILHPKDVAKVKEQLFSSDLNPRERFIDSKTMLPVKADVPIGATRLSPGARRSFLCRMKCRPTVQIKEEADTTTGCHRQRKKTSSERRYCVVQCTGYMKSWSSARMSVDEGEADGDGESEGHNLSCLVAVGRLVASDGAKVAPICHRPGPHPNPQHYVSRHAVDGTFTFVDQRGSAALGFLPQELLGTSVYDYFHQDDIRGLSECHRATLRCLSATPTPCYRFRIKDGGYVRIQSEWRQFRNPWTKDVEYIIAKNVIVGQDVSMVESSAARLDGSAVPTCGYEVKCEGGGGGSALHRLLPPHEAAYIGQQIAKEVLQKGSGGVSSEGGTPSPRGMDQEPCLSLTSLQSPMSTSMLDDAPGGSGILRIQGHVTPDGYHENVRNNVPLSCSADTASSDQEMMDVPDVPDVMAQSSPVVTTEGNDEAAMAVIMSLLEADAGLGGPVDFSGLPWPLP